MFLRWHSRVPVWFQAVAPPPVTKPARILPVRCARDKPFVLAVGVGSTINFKSVDNRVFAFR
jgi:hypothetical protein